MPANDDQPKLPGSTSRRGAPASGILGKIMTAIASAAVLVVAFMVSLLFFAIVAAAAFVIGGYLWWKTRELRKQMRERPPGGRVIDGEVIRDDNVSH